MEENLAYSLSSAYKKYVPSPGAQHILLATLLFPTVYALRDPAYDYISRAAQDPRLAAVLGMKPHEIQKAMAQMKGGFAAKHGLPWLLAGTPIALSMASNWDSKDPIKGMATWNRQLSPTQQGLVQYRKNKQANKQALQKTAALWQASQGYQPQLDFSMPVARWDAQSLLKNNPYLQHSAYAKNLGTSIVTAAPYTGGVTTLGGIYDSAVNKFDKKLQRQGFGSKAVKSVVSGSLAGMFTDIVGGVLGVPDPLRRNVATSVGVGKALYQILT